MEQNSLTNSKQRKQRSQLYNFVFGSAYGQYLKNTYRHFVNLEQDEKDKLIITAQILRVKNQKSTLTLNFAKTTINVIVYGEVKVKDKIYPKGNYFYSEIQKVQILFLKKTAIVMLDRQHVEESIRALQETHLKMEIIKNKLGLNIHTRQLTKLALKVQNVQKSLLTSNDKIIKQQPGVYLLVKGQYFLIDQTQKPIIQLIEGLYGQECLWGKKPDYQLRVLSKNCSYLWISKHTLLNVLSQQQLKCIKTNNDSKIKLHKTLVHNFKLIPKKQIFQKKKRAISCPQKIQFQKMLQGLKQKCWQPKWKRQQNQLKQKIDAQCHRKRLYRPKKVKSKYFSTLTSRDKTEQSYFMPEDNHFQFKPKMHYHQRFNTTMNILSKTSPEQKINSASKNSTYYSTNYDKTYSQSQENFSKMQRYHDLKKQSTLKRGQKWYTIKQYTMMLNDSFAELRSVLQSSSQKIDPEKLKRKQQKRTQILIKKKMQNGNRTFR